MDDANKPLRELFDKIDAKELAAMKDRREEESFNLDFKQMDPSGEPSADDKRNLREVISGYANSAGGIILWGVDSKSREDRRDRSRFQGIVPVKDGDRAAVRFHELTATATQPAVSGVIHKAIAVEGGFVVKTFVPSSDGGPHRTNEEKGQYFRRDADAFRAMQHHEIADMFGRRARPRLELWWEQAGDDEKFLRENAWVIGLRNVGRGIARFPALGLRVRPDRDQMKVLPLRDFDEGGAFGLPRKQGARVGGNEYFFGGEGNEVIHPGQALQVARIGLVGNAAVCRVKFEIFAEHMQTVEGAFRIALGEKIRLDTPEDDQW